MAISAAQWKEIKADRIADAAGRLAALPDEYRAWVVREMQGRGFPSLRVGADLGVGEVQSYDVLIARCEREIERRTTTTTGDDAA